MSLSLDLPDKDYEWMQLSGAWSRERYIKNRTLEQGITAIDSMRGNSSHEHNPFLALKRHNTDENAGEAIGLSLVYSGNFRMQAEVDTHDVTRIYSRDQSGRIRLEIRTGRKLSDTGSSSGLQ